MSMERFLCIASPFGYTKLSKKAAKISLALIWALGLIMAILPGNELIFCTAFESLDDLNIGIIRVVSVAVIYWRQSTHYYGSNGLCFPLHIGESLSLGWQYSAFIFLGVNSLW